MKMVSHGLVKKLFLNRNFIHYFFFSLIDYLEQCPGFVKNKASSSFSEFSLQLSSSK